MFNLIMFGPPGAGKGTQSVRIAQKYQLKHVSTGDILREEVRRESVIGRMARQYLDQGQLVPDEVLISILHKLVEENRYINGFVLDGFPRTLVQAEAFDKMLAGHGLSVSLVISLVVDEEDLVARLVKRAAEQGRTDDKPEVIRHRLETYKKQTRPLIDYFLNRTMVIPVPGMGTIDEVFEGLCSEIEKVMFQY